VCGEGEEEGRQWRRDVGWGGVRIRGRGGGGVGGGGEGGLMGEGVVLRGGSG